MQQRSCVRGELENCVALEWRYTARVCVHLGSSGHYTSWHLLKLRLRNLQAAREIGINRWRSPSLPTTVFSIFFSLFLSGSLTFLFNANWKVEGKRFANLDSDTLSRAKSKPSSSLSLRGSFFFFFLQPVPIRDNEYLLTNSSEIDISSDTLK